MPKVVKISHIRKSEWNIIHFGIIYALANENSNTGNVRETFFINQTSVNHNVTSSKKVDFMINDFTFEVGGKSKEQKQIQG